MQPLSILFQRFRKPLLILLPIVAIMLLLSWRNAHKDPVAVLVKPVERGAVEATISNTRAGTIKACRRSRLSMPLGGKVDKLYVKEGDRVTNGQLLLELWNDDYRARVEQAEASVNSAEHEQQRACLSAGLNTRERKRLDGLQEKGLASKSQVDTSGTLASTSSQQCDASKAQVLVARAALSMSRAQLELTSLKAPFAGVIAEINGELGEYVTPSPPGVLTPPAIDLIDDSCLYVTAPIDEVDAQPVRKDMKARITMDAFRGRTFDGKVTRIAPYVMDLEKQARTVDVDVYFDNIPADLPLLVGYSADIEIITDSRDKVLRIPTESIFDIRDVYVLEAGGTLAKRSFTPGLGNWTHTEVMAGLVEGDQVVVTPDRVGVKDGAAAKIDDTANESATQTP